MKGTKRLLDLKSEILRDADVFMSDFTNIEDFSSIKEESSKSFNNKKQEDEV